MMKKVLCLTLALVFLLALSACGNREKVVEKTIESAAQKEGQDVDIDVDDDGKSISITKDDGSYSVIAEEGMVWPEDTLPSDIPEIPGVSVSGTVDSGAGVTVVFKDCDEDTINAYIDTLKNLGWKDATNMGTEGGVLVIFEKSGAMLTLTWDNGDNVGSIMYGTP